MLMNMRANDEFRVVFVGDDSTGKTSLIQTILVEKFPKSVPGLTETVTIAGEYEGKSISVDLIDTSKSVQTENEINEEILTADAICLTYCDLDSLSNLRNWLFTIWNLGSTSADGSYIAPVVIVKTKTDADQNIFNDTDEKILFDLKQEFSNIVGHLKTSALQFKNIFKLFYELQMASIEPSQNIYNKKTQKFSPKMDDVLKNIFKIVDMDKDGYLMARDLLKFHAFAFDETITESKALRIVKGLQSCYPATANGDMISESGFMQMMLKFAKDDMIEVVWKMLRKFSYSNRLELKLDPNILPLSEAGESSQIMLSYIALDFVSGIIFPRLAKSSTETVIDSQSVMADLPDEDYCKIKEEKISVNQLKLFIVYLFEKDPRECLRLFLRYGFMYSYASLSLCFGSAAQFKAGLNLVNLSKTAFFMTNLNERSKLLESISAAKNIQSVHTAHATIFSQDTDCLRETFIIDQSNNPGPGWGCIIEVSCLAKDYANYACQKYNNDIADLGLKCGFVVYAPQQSGVNDNILHGLVDFCALNQIEPMVLTETTETDEIANFLRKVSPGAVHGLLCSNKSNGFYSNGKFNFSYLKSYLVPPRAKIDSFLFPVVLVAGVALMLFRRRGK